MYDIYSNSYKPQKEQSIRRIKRNRKNRPFLIYFIIGVFIIFFFIIFINNSSFFQIKNIEVKNDKISETTITATEKDTIANKIYSDVSKKYTNILFFSSMEIKKYLMENFLEISNIDVNKQLFERKIYISYSYREPKYYWCYLNDCFLIDDKGVIFKKDNSQYKEFLVIENEYYKNFKLGQKIPNNILYIINNFLINIEKKDIYFKKITIKNNNLIIFYLDIKNNENNLNNTIKVKFSLIKDLDEQLQKAFSLISYLSSDDLKKIDYIDLRVKEKVYYNNI